MSVTKNIRVLLSANSSSLRSQLALAGREVDRFQNKVQSSSKGTTLATQAMKAGVVALATATAVALGYGAKAAAAFETRMRNVNSISGLSETQFRALGRSVVDLSKQLPQSANTLAEGLYDIASSGFQGADGLTVLKASAEAASAGLTDTATSARAITAVLNAYGLGADQANTVSDTLFQTVNLGVVSFGELAGVIGDVVGTAAAAKVNIGEVGAAIAAMTLSGISGAESGTSLNRVIQSLIQPSDELAAVLLSLGYASGEQALAADGLHGVMERLRQVTHGNVTTLLQLFPEIRAARGAFALMAADGANYNRTFEGIANSTNSAGATQKALREQMKAVSAQFHLFVNQINAGAIALGTKLLPTILSVMRGLQKLGVDAAPKVRAAFVALIPFFHNLAQAGVNLVEVFSEIAKAVGPAAKLLAGVAFAGLVATLTALSAALETVTGFFAENKEVVLALAAVITAALLPAIANGVVLLGSLYASLVAQKVAALGSAAANGTLAASLTAVTVSSAAATLGIAAILAALGAAVYGIQHSSQMAKKLAGDLSEVGSPNSLIEYNKALSSTREALEKNIQTQSRYKGIGGFIKTDLELFTPMENKFSDAVMNAQELEKAQDKLRVKAANLNKNLRPLMATTGLTAKAMGELADKAGVDLTSPFEDSEEARQKALDEYKKLQSEIGLSGKALENQTGLDVDAMQALADAIKDVKAKALSAFAGATDVVANFRIEKGKGSAGKQLETFYRESISKANTFVTEITQVTQRGLDPQLIQRLLEAGPEAAGPTLQALVSDHSGRLISMANASEAALRQISLRVAEFARLTTLATTSRTDEMVRDLGAAMKIASENMAEGAAATAESIGRALGIVPADVLRIAEEYGITIMGAVQNGINSKTPVIPTPKGPPGGHQIAADGMVYMANGGSLEAHIARTTRIMYAEPGTGGEAFIPLGWNKRGRSKALLADVANRFGMAVTEKMADGGVRVPVNINGHQGGTTVVRVIERRVGVEKLEVNVAQAQADAHEIVSEAWWTFTTRGR